MRIARITNKYMYKCEDKEHADKHHYYLLYYDRKNKHYNAIQLTHLYIRDEDRFKLIDKNLAIIEKFKEFKVPSGVRKGVYTKTYRGKNINLNSKYIEKLYDRHLSKKQSDRIKEFAIPKKMK